MNMIRIFKEQNIYITNLIVSLLAKGVRAKIRVNGAEATITYY